MVELQPVLAQPFQRARQLAVERAFAQAADEYRDLLMIGRFAAILLGMLGLGLAWLWLERDRTDPIAELRHAIDFFGKK